MTFDPRMDVQRSAKFSECRTYRYTLLRKYPALPINVRPREGRILWILLNPSTADENFDDPTNTRVAKYSLRWGFKIIQTVNLFAVRCPDPSILAKVVDPVGPENDRIIRREIRKASMIVCGWGNLGTYQKRDLEVVRMLKKREVHPFCLGCTGSGQPIHPSPRNVNLPDNPIEWDIY